jgi:hypothetical protein
MLFGVFWMYAFNTFQKRVSRQKCKTLEKKKFLFFLHKSFKNPAWSRGLGPWGALFLRKAKTDIFLILAILLRHVAGVMDGWKEGSKVHLMAPEAVRESVILAVKSAMHLF